MKKNKQNKVEKNNRYDKGRIFVKVMAGILAMLTMAGTVGTLVFALI